MHRVDQCGSLTDCYSCVTSNDPICGWCALPGTCARSSECQSVSDSGGVTRRVFVQNEFMCPRIEASTPSVIHIEQLQVCVHVLCLSLCLSVCPSVLPHHSCPPARLSVCLSVRLSVHPSVCLTVCVCLCLSPITKAHGTQMHQFSRLP